MSGGAGNNAADGAVRRVVDTFGASVSLQDAGELHGLLVDKAKLHEVLHFLKTEKETPFAMLTDLFPIDLETKEPRFEVVYLLNSLDAKARLVVKTRLNDGEAAQTVSDLFGTANWLEREAYDMFGLRFEGHPNLTRILMVDDFDGHPLRKDFPTQGYGFEQPFVVDLEKET
jgi:NADH-quinone oxidoreductase subunit C